MIRSVFQALLFVATMLAGLLITLAMLAYSMGAI